MVEYDKTVHGGDIELSGDDDTRMIPAEETSFRVTEVDGEEVRSIGKAEDVLNIAPYFLKAVSNSVGIIQKVGVFLGVVHA